ncbi:MAG: flagellar biosynthesis protein FlhB [Peptococcaceae bacterium]|nr:flagellar biosynthesis protein FlhB [Peptococcaceae bacterium]
MSQQGAEERSEQATPKRLSEARDKGQVAKSMDLISAVGFFGVMVAFATTAGRFITYALTYLIRSLSTFAQHTARDAGFGHLFGEAVASYIFMVWPALLGALVIGVVANVLQSGFIWSLDPIKPELNRLNPIDGLGRMFSTRALFDLLKAMLKMALVGYAVFSGVQAELGRLLQSGFAEGMSSLVLVGRVLWVLALRVSLVYVLIGIVDFLYQRYEHKKNLMMSRQEVKEEHKQMEGDPQIRAKQRERARLLATRRMFSAIPEATVVITNPTHYAIALKYEENSGGAPTVVAKGSDYLAQRIIAKAKEAGVPIVQQPEVARALYRQVELGREIPLELYRLVAEVLAVVLSRGGGL